MTVEFIFIIGIIVAIIGTLSIAAVMWQSEAKPSAAQPASEVSAPGTAEIPADTLTTWPFDTPPQTDETAAPIAETHSPVEPSVTLEPDEPPLTIESITASYAHANDDVVVAESSLQINVANLLATQIERLYQEYVRLEEERARLAETLLTNMLFEKIERSAGRLEITTERETLDLRERFSQVSADYDRVQFRLGSLQHLNLRLNDPRVAQQLDELVLEVKRLAQKTEA
jgi:hypothetical protein